MNRIKCIKYVVVTLFLSLCLILPGELYQNYLDQFNDFFQTTFYLPEDCTAEEMKNELTEKADEYNVHIFKIVKSNTSVLSSQLDIYCDDYVATYLRNKYSVYFGRHNSIFSGETLINQYRFDNITEDMLLNDANYYLIGDFDDLTKFKVALIDKYAGSFPQEDGINILRSCEVTIATSFIILLLLNVFLSYFDAEYQKKEIFIRLTLGQSTLRYYLKNILLDSCYMIGACFLISASLIKFIGSIPFYQYTPFGIIAVVLSNILVYLRLFKINYKAIISDSNMNAERKNLKINYILHGLCFSLVMIAIASNIAIAFECVNYYRQKPFFEDYSDYYWYQSFKVNNDSNYNEDDLTNQIMNQYMDDMSIFYLCEGASIDDDGKTYFYEANHNTLDYLQSEIDILNTCSLNNDVYILIHKNTRLSEDEIDSLISWADSDSYQVLYYDDSAEIVYRKFDSEPITAFAKNPIIIFYNHEEPSDENTTKYELFLCMIQTDKQVLIEFAQNNSLTYSETNALEYFFFRWTTLSRTLLLNIVVLILMLVMEGVVSYTIISLEFKVNATELALKKIHGYSIYERYKKIILETVSLWGVCLIIATILLSIINPEVIVFELIGATAILIINLGCIFGQILRHENKKIPTILKGGAL